MGKNDDVTFVIPQNPRNAAPPGQRTEVNPRPSAPKPPTPPPAQKTSSGGNKGGGK